MTFILAVIAFIVIDLVLDAILIGPARLKALLAMRFSRRDTFPETDMFPEQWEEHPGEDPLDEEDPETR